MLYKCVEWKAIAVENYIVLRQSYSKGHNNKLYKKLLQNDARKLIFQGEATKKLNKKNMIK